MSFSTSDEKNAIYVLCSKSQQFTCEGQIFVTLLHSVFLYKSVFKVRNELHVLQDSFFQETVGISIVLVDKVKVPISNKKCIINILTK